MSDASNTKLQAKPKPAEDTGDQPSQEFISRRNLAKRWDISVEFLKHKERAGELKPVRLGYRSMAYRLRDVIAYEDEITS